jgi:L-lactate utilization protein LutB
VWYDCGATGEFDLPIGAVVKSADTGQIVIVTDDGEVRVCVSAWVCGWTFVE